MSKKFEIKTLHDKGEHDYCEGGCFSKGGDIQAENDSIDKNVRELGISEGEQITPGLNVAEVLSRRNDPGYLRNTVGKQLGTNGKGTNRDTFVDKDTQAFADGGEVDEYNAMRDMADGAVPGGLPEAEKNDKIEDSDLGLLLLPNKVKDYNDMRDMGDGAVPGTLPKAEVDDETLQRHFDMGGQVGNASQSAPQVYAPEEDADSKKKGMPTLGYSDGGDPSQDAQDLASMADGAVPGGIDPNDVQAGLDQSTPWNIKNAISNSPIGKVYNNLTSAGTGDTNSQIAKQTNPNLTSAIKAGLGQGINAALGTVNPTGINPQDTIPSQDTMKTLGLGGHVNPNEAAVGNETLNGNPNSQGGGNPVGKPSGVSGAKSTSNFGLDQDTAMADYFKQQNGLLDKYGPEKQAAANQAINKAQYGFMGGITQALGGFSDAIMQGVARAGQGHTLENIQNSWKDLRQNIVGEMKDMNAQEKSAVMAHIGMLDKDPTTGYAKGIQAAASKLMGDKTGTAFANVPPGMLTDIMKNAVDSQDAQARLAELISNNAQLRTIQEQGVRAGAAEKVMGGSIIPFVGPSHTQKQEVIKPLVNLATGGSNGLSPQDQKAVAWARQNPNDNRAKSILALHGLAQ